MSVIGIDFGNENSFIAVARAGGIETLANEYSQRITPSYVAFGEKTRDLGVSAKNKQITNLKNTVYGFKKLIGRKFRDPVVQQEISYLPYNVCELPNGSIGVKVHYLDEEQVFTVQQIMGMLFTKFKEIAESNLKIKVNDCVISVPSFYTDAERRAMLDAAQIAGLDALRLMNETTAVALTYGFYKQDLPDDKPRNMIFVDMGHSALQVTACAFTKGKLRVIATVWDANVGGRDFDNVLVRYFAEDFRKRYNLDVINNKRAIMRLLTECEKLKKQMSANTNKLPLNIECFMDDKDVSGRLSREDFERMSESLFHRVEVTFKKILQESNLKCDDIEAVEVVGGSTRVPAIKRLVQKVFGKEPSTTLNLDEAVARGCALQCAMLSPAFKVKDYEILDVQPYPITLYWKAEENGEMEVFSRFHKVPFYRKLTFMRKEPFSLEARYSPKAEVSYPDTNLGNYTVTKVTPNAEGESSKVEVKLHVNIHGIFSVHSATLFEKQQEQVNETEPMDDQEQDKSNDPAKSKDEKTPNGETVPNSEETMQTEESNNDSKPETKEGKKSKKVVKTVKLPIDALLPQLSETEITNCIKSEGDMILQDKKEKEKADAKNAVEEYVYEMRENLAAKLEKFVSESDKEIFNKLLNDTEDWLYDEGEDKPKTVYIEKLEELKKLGQPIVNRMKEAEERPLAIEVFLHSLQMVRKELSRFDAKDEFYSHIDSSDMEKVHKAVIEKQDWLDRQLGALQACSNHQNPPVLASQIYQEKNSFENFVRPILTKPKPKVELPPEPQQTTDESATAGSDGADQQNGAGKSPKPQDVSEHMDMD